MPHSVSPESSPPAAAAMDETMLEQEDAVALGAKAPSGEGTEDTSQSNGDAMDVDAVSQDKTKLEDMFDDDDVDFPSSADAVPL
jgi:hypothetical protein